MGWERSGTPELQVGPDPTVFAFWRPDIDPAFEVVCEPNGEPLSYRLESLQSAADTRVARIEVETEACERFVVRTTRGAPSLPGGEGAHYRVQSDFEQPSDRPRPFVVSAQRENKRFGCGPSSHLAFETNVRPAALRIEVEPGADVIVVPTRLLDADAQAEDGGRFWLGRTMCRGPNLAEQTLDQPMTLRVSALYADGSTDVGPWQRISPPPGYRGGQDEVDYAVQEPSAALPSPAVQGGTARAATPGGDRRRWLWLLLAFPGVLALARWAARRRP